MICWLLTIGSRYLILIFNIPISIKDVFVTTVLQMISKTQYFGFGFKHVLAQYVKTTVITYLSKTGSKPWIIYYK